jgi:hypothetical protein
MFTIKTETGETACVLHLHIPGTTMSSWLVVRPLFSRNLSS